MAQGKRILGMVAAALSTSGCASFEGMPRPVTPTMAAAYLEGDKVAQELIDKETDSNKQRAIRNNVVWAHIRAADAQYRQFLVSLNKNMKGANFGLDLGGVLVSSIGAVAHGAANELSAAAAALSGARGSINRELYFEKTLPAIEAAMRGNRTRVKTQIATHLINDDVSRYSLQQALADLDDYQLAASLNAAIQEITTTTGVAADQAQQRYENATESCGPTAEVAPLWGRLNDFVFDLADAANSATPGTDSEKAKKLEALAEVLQMVTGTAGTKATTEAEATAQAEAIIIAAKKYCTEPTASSLLVDITAKTGMNP
jgi:hypothetical protein